MGSEQKRVSRSPPLPHVAAKVAEAERGGGAVQKEEEDISTRLGDLGVLLASTCWIRKPIQET